MPAWLPMAAVAGGTLLSHLGGNRAGNAASKEAKRLEEEERARARGRAALMRGILNANGYGGMVNDKMLEQILLRTAPRPGTGAGAGMSALGGALTGIGSRAILADRDDPEQPTPTAAAGSAMIPETGASLGTDNSNILYRLLDQILSGQNGAGLGPR